MRTTGPGPWGEEVYGDEPGEPFPRLNDYREYVTAGAWGILALSFVVASLRYWLSSYSGSGTHWRRGEARAVARRVKELVDTGAATPGEIVLLFAAGTDAE